jgi:FdhE protein
MLLNDTEEIVFQSVRETAQTIDAQKPDLHNALEPFSGLFQAIETVQEKLGPWDLQGMTMDQNQFLQGKPLLNMVSLVDFSSQIDMAREILFPVLITRFPPLADAVEAIGKAAEKDDEPGLYASMQSFLEGDEKALETAAEQMKISSDVFGFVLSQLAAPFLRSQAKALAEHFDLTGWTQGYCPICGSLPSVSYLRGEGGKRWLHCPTCGHDWKFKRQTCPACDNIPAKGLEYFYLEDRLFERAYVCKECKKYLLTIDVRELTDKPNMDIASIGLIPLDIKAQEEGYEPLNVLPWNTFD